MKGFLLSAWRVTLGVFVFGILGLAGIKYFSDRSATVTQAEVDAVRGHNPVTTTPPANPAPEDSKRAEEGYLQQAAQQPVVSVKQVVNDYEENKLNADAKYKGKTIRLQGLMESVDGSNSMVLKTFPTDTKDANSDPAGALTEGMDNELARVDLSFHDSARAVLPTLRRGQRLDLLCTGAGQSIGNPDFENCTFISVDKILTPQEVQAKKFAENMRAIQEQRQRDAEAAEKAYADKVAKGLIECNGEGDSRVCYDKTATN
ncbi:OB-fold protein [Paraburkholderia sediminicola]|uniref:OB-fold protein n=1 Tax=Paraburkholderia sediminicola TaxID=458836 RepID=UPI0038BAE9B6